MRANSILDAQPGIEATLVMRRQAGGEGVGLDEVETAVEITRRLWR